MKKIIELIKKNKMKLIISTIAAILVIIMVVYGVNRIFSFLFGAGIIGSTIYLKKRKKKLSDIKLKQGEKIEEVNDNYDNSKHYNDFIVRRRKERKRSQKNKQW